MPNECFVDLHDLGRYECDYAGSQLAVYRYTAVLLLDGAIGAGEVESDTSKYNHCCCCRGVVRYSVCSGGCVLSGPLTAVRKKINGCHFSFPGVARRGWGERVFLRRTASHASPSLIVWELEVVPRSRRRQALDSFVRGSRDVTGTDKTQRRCHIHRRERKMFISRLSRMWIYIVC